MIIDCLFKKKKRMEKDKPYLQEEVHIRVASRQFDSHINENNSSI